jgi:hypothetical protein
MAPSMPLRRFFFSRAARAAVWSAAKKGEFAGVTPSPGTAPVRA